MLHCPATGTEQYSECNTIHQNKGHSSDHAKPVSIKACTCTHSHTHTHTYASSCVQAHTNTHTHNVHYCMHAQTRIHVHTHTQTHTHKHTHVSPEDRTRSYAGSVTAGESRHQEGMPEQAAAVGIKLAITPPRVI